MSSGLLALATRLERHRSLLGAFKLANVGLAMGWGFVVTFVFVRLLPIAEFRAFLLLVAFANFTISAELGFSTIIYSRMRRSRLGGQADKGDFRSEELSVLLLFMAAIIGVGVVIIGVGLATGLIPTERPVLFLTFYIAVALNLIAVLAKRALAALDHNLWWEAIDTVRRLISLGFLIAALFGLPLLVSVSLQLACAVIVIVIGLATVQGELAMPMSHWWSLRVGSAHVRDTYLADIGRTGLLTLSDIAAYNAPYFTIVAATQDARPLLLFDFIYKMSRALSGLIRAMVETALPDLTRHFHARELPRFRSQLGRTLGLSLAIAAGLALLVLWMGPRISSTMFDGKLRLNRDEIAWIDALLAGLAIMCVSVYLQNGLGQFAALVPPSLVFLAGGLASVPVALRVEQAAGVSFALAFAGVYAVVHLVMAAVHGRMLARLGR